MRTMESFLKGKMDFQQKNNAVLLKKYSSMTVWSGVLIAIFPILAPYDFFGISLNWILGIIFVVCRLFKRAKLPIMPSVKPLAIYTLLSAALSLNGLLVLQNPRNLINAEIAMIADLVIYMMLWFYSDIDVTIKYANIIGYICCGYATIQIIATITGTVVPLGKLPIFEISTGWIPEVWGFRFNSLFSEPSYFAIYLLPIFLYNFLKSNWINAIVFASFIVLSSSSLGIISMTIVFLLSFVSGEFTLKNKIKIIAVLLVVIVLGCIIMKDVPFVASFIKRSFLKIKEIFGSSSNGGFAEDIRLGGYLYLFDEIPVKEQLFGVGNAQLQNYFAERGVHIFNYSNSFVLSLLNFGLLGFVAFIAFLGNLCCISRKERTFLFWLILVLTLAVDSLLFSYRYYWLVYFVLFSNKRMEKLSQ